MPVTLCIIKTKSLDKDGYPVLLRRIDGKNRRFRAARYWYEQRFGKIGEGKVIDHLCRNRGCINITHLEIVSIAENTRRGKSAKLTYDDVKEIRDKYKMKLYNQYELAREYGVGQYQISRIINERRWSLSQPL